jgi:hypothetical protein
MITAKELREQLENIPDDTVLVMQTDDEGNGYRYVNGVEFTPKGNSAANYYDPSSQECWRLAELDFMEYSKRQIAKLKVCAVVY